MKDNLHLRPAQLSDAQAIRDIYAYYVDHMAVTFEVDPPSLEEMEDRMRATMSRYPYLVVEDQGRVIGFSYASAYRDRRAYDWAVETTIYVDADNRKSGVGRRLYQGLEKICQAQNICNLTALVTFADREDDRINPASEHFHERLGFVKVGHYTKIGYKFNEWYDLILMEKVINDHQADMPEVIPFEDLDADLVEDLLK